MASEYIQLVFGVVRDREKEKKIQPNLPPNYEKMFCLINYLILQNLILQL